MARERKTGRDDSSASVSTSQPLVSMAALSRWLLPGMAVLLYLASWVRCGQVTANNRPPLRLLAMEGEEDWPQRELLRIRCGFNGQFLAVADRVWIPCATGAKRWELMRWDLARGVIQRRWQATHSPKDSSTVEVVSQQGLLLHPVIAAVLRLDKGNLALVMHGQRSNTAVELVIARSKGGLSHYPLPSIRPFVLVGFAAVGGRYELLTADCRRHVLEPGKPLVSAPLAGCPYDGKAVLEWAQRQDKSWRFVYARPSERPARSALFLVEPGTDKGRPIGTLRDATQTTRGEKLDMSPGNVLPLATAHWPTHRLVKATLTPLERPPKTLLAGTPRVSTDAKHIILLDRGGLRRLQAWNALTLGSERTGGTAGGGGSAPSRTIQRWRWLIQQPTRWIGGERLQGEKTLRLVANAPDRTLDIHLPRAAPAVLNAIPATGGGTWLFNTLGHHLKVDDGLHRTDAPGLTDRVRRIWRLHHLQRQSLSGPPGNPERQSAWRGLAHRAALPVVLAGLPLLLLLAAPLARRAGRARDPKRPFRASLARPTWPWILAAALYLLSAGALLWPFWQVTTAF